MHFLPRQPKVFISYRRDPGIDLASRICSALEKHGIDVFQDWSDLEKGQFGTQLFQAIEERIFLPVLTPGTLNRCRQNSSSAEPFNEDDWVLKEIMHAVNQQCECIPLFTPKFDFNDLVIYLPERAAQRLGDLNGIKIDQEALFEPSIEQIHKQIEKRAWIRKLHNPWVRRGIYGLIGLVMLCFVGLLTYSVYYRINPPPPAPIELPAPSNALSAPGAPIDKIQHIRSIAISAANVWLATEDGLWVYRAEGNYYEPVPSVSSNLNLIDTDETGSLVWFVLADNTIGLYNDISEMPQPLSSTDVDTQGFSLAINTSTLSSDGKTAWIGTNLGQILQYLISQDEWTNYVVRPWDSAPDISIPINQMSIDQLDEYTVFWVTNLSSIYRGTDRPDTIWDRINSVTIADNQLGIIHDIAVDRYGHLWIAHESGLSILSQKGDTWDMRTVHLTSCTPNNSPLLSAPVYSLSAASGGQWIWLVSEGGVNMVETSEQIQDCDRYQWFYRAADPNDLFWTLPSKDYLQIEANQGESNSAWVFLYDTIYVRTYTFE